MLDSPTFLPLYANVDGIEAIELPDNVTKLAAGAFCGCHQLRKITIPDSVSILEDSVFKDCSALQEIILPEAVERIPPFTFTYCASLQRITMSRTAFLSVGFVSEEDLPASTTVVSVKKTWINQLLSPFHGCAFLQKIILYKDQELIEQEKRKKAESKANGIWEDNSFVYRKTSDKIILLKCRKKNPRVLTIPAFVSEIAASAFDECERIGRLQFEDGITSINPTDFSRVKIGQIIISESITNIKSPGFMGFTYHSYTGDYFPGFTISLSNPRYGFAGSFFVEKTSDGLKTLYICPFDLNKVEVPDSVTCIGSKTFSDLECASVIVSPSVRRIESQAFSEAYIYRLEIQEGCEILEDDWAHNLSVLTLILPASVQSVGKCKLDLLFSINCKKGSAAASWAISNGYAHSLKLSAAQRTKQTVSDSTPISDPIMLFTVNDNHVVRYNYKSQSDLNLESLLLKHPELVFENGLFAKHTELQTVILPDGMTCLPKHFFAGCSHLHSVHLPESMRTLEKGAFTGCALLGELIIPEHVETIHPDLFGCTPVPLLSGNQRLIYGIPGSNAEAFAAAGGYAFKDYRETASSSVDFREYFSFRETPDSIEIKDILKHDESDTIVIPDTIYGKPVVSLSCTSDPGRKKMRIGRNLKTLEIPYYDALEKLTDIEIDPENPYFTIENGVLYEQTTSTLKLILPSARQEKRLSVRAGTKKIDPSVFRYCPNLKELYLPISISFISTATSVKSSFSDPLTIFGFTGSAALNFARSNHCVFVDLTLPEKEQELVRKFKMLPTQYTFTDRTVSKYGYVSHGYTGPERDACLPDHIGNLPVTATYRWPDTETPDTLRIPKTLLNAINGLYT